MTLPFRGGDPPIPPAPPAGGMMGRPRIRPPASSARHRKPGRSPGPRRKPGRRATGRDRLIWRAGAITAAGALIAIPVVLLTRGTPALLVTSFPMARRLITNERAYSSPHRAGVHLSRTWEVTSGSLFSDHGAGWTGVPDDVAPDIDSSNGTDSAVFRVVTRRATFGNVSVGFDLRISRLVSTRRTPAVAYDGVHVFLRYQNPAYLYVVSVYRRDGIVAVKEKIPGGTINGGTYVTLAEARYRMPRQQWVPVRVSIVSQPDGTVRIELTIGGRTVLTETQDHSKVDPILKPGRVGIRGDNCEFWFRHFTVEPAAS
jgi:hypothetical protein